MTWAVSGACLNALRSRGGISPDVKGPGQLGAGNRPTGFEVVGVDEVLR
jgi:hypothetical protein